MPWPCVSNLGSRSTPSTNLSETSPNDVRYNVSNSEPKPATLPPISHLCAHGFDLHTHLVTLDPGFKRYTHLTPVNTGYNSTTLLSTMICKTTPLLLSSKKRVAWTCLSRTTH